MDEEAAAKGGRERAARMTPSQRRESAQRAAAARWGRDLPEAMFGSASKPLRIGNVEIGCYIVDREGEPMRLLASRGITAALGMARSGRGDGDRLAGFVRSNSLKPYVAADLLTATKKPIKFRAPQRGPIVHGYEATVLVDLCEAVLAARRAGALAQRQMHIALQAEILQGAFAKTGIIALVDEATGFQYSRARRALEDVLQQFISQELLKWVKVFPDDFYREMFRLRGWRYDDTSSARPGIVGRDTNDIVYGRLAPGVLDELRRITPRYDSGRPKHKYHQRLTEDVGHPKLREHLIQIIALMRASRSWDEFQDLISRACPRYGDQLRLDLRPGPGE